MEKGKISAKQFMIIVVLFTIGSSIIMTPPILVKGSHQDAWLSGIIGLIVSLIVIWLYTSLGSRFPQMTIVQYSEVIFGKWVGKVVAIFFLFYFFILSSLLLNEIGEFITIQVMPETPAIALHILFLFIVLAGTRLGLEPLARSAEIFLPWAFFLFVVTAIMLFPVVEIKNIQPILENGMKPLFVTAYQFSGNSFFELFILLMIFPYINEKAQAKKKAYFLGTILGGIALITVILFSILVVGADQTKIQIYPTYILAKKINVGNFLQRLEVIMAFVWFITIFIKLAFCFYGTVLGLSQLLRLNDFRVLTYPLGFILIPFSLIIVENVVNLYTVAGDIWPSYTLVQGVFLPFVMFIVSVIRKKNGLGRSSGNEKNI